MKFKGKTVFITGAAKRIGAEIARYFAQNGANICLHFNKSEKEALTLQKELLKLTSKVSLFKADLINTKEILTVFENAILEFGKIDFLVNNASMFQKNNFLNITEEDFERDLNIQTKTPLFLIQRFAKQNFNEQNQGFILNMLDKNIFRKNTSFLSYLLSKKALLNLTEFAAFELAPNIRVNAVSLGFILPEENMTINESYFKEKLLNIPLNKQGSWLHVIKTIDFLIENTYITGENITIDGGSFLKL